ncbi:MAG: hypothetical protein ACLTER_20705 [Ruminococcus sp.]
MQKANGMKTGFQVGKMLTLQWKHSKKTTGGWLVYDVIGYQRLY